MSTSELKCACVDGDRNVPIGFLSLHPERDDHRDGALDGSGADDALDRALTSINGRGR